MVGGPMNEKVDYDTLEQALRRCGASWNAAQAHGLLTGMLSVGGVSVAPDWRNQVLEDTDAADALRRECQGMLDSLYQATFWELSERLSEFAVLLPGEDRDAAERTAAMANWCEGYLHGLVSTSREAPVKDRLAAEPLADIIRDMLQITRATVGDGVDDETNEGALTEIVEYLRVAAQLAYEELADIRHKTAQ